MGMLASEVLNDEPRVVMFTAPNPGPKTLTGTHTYVVGEKSAHVIDPGPPDASYQQLLADFVRDAGLTVEAILLTHGHPDHAPGAAVLKQWVGAPVWASDRMSESARTAAGVDYFYGPAQRFGADMGELRIIASPGHSADSVALWMPRARILFAGDTILGQGTTLIAPPEGDMVQYMETLERLRALNALLIAPGHGPVIRDPAGKFEEYIEHRRQREAQIVAALEDGPAGIRELVARIYTDVDPGLHDLAAASVEAQLAKLLHERRVHEAGGLFSLAKQT